MPEYIHNFLFSYYGLDWAAAVFMFLSMYRLGKHKKDGFVYAALASLCWIAFNLIAQSAAGVVANAIIAAMAFRSLATWSKTHPNTSTTPDS
ncbi:MAG: hypothetical protein JJ974_01025 [Phycisphaerales bacterium]|nr:hypothetical protein [Phycisphaerales bacterium]